MERKFLPLEESDYEKICEFWDFWNFAHIPRNCLPNNGLGGLKIVDDQGIIICAGFLYETNSGIAWLDFIVLNPYIKDRKVRYDAQIELISLLTVEAEEKGFSAVFSSVTNKHLIKKYVEIGYTTTPNATELIIKL
jgi:hypothetical protein